MITRTIRNRCIVFGIALVLSAELFAQTEADRLPWEGAWQWLHEAQDGRLGLTAEHFCAVFGLKNRMHLSDGGSAEADAAQLYRSMAGPMCGSVSFVQTAAGRWAVKTTVEVAAYPQNVGESDVRPTTVDGDLMVGEWLNADGSVRNTWRYRRLSDLGGESQLAGVWRTETGEKVGLLILTDTQYRYVWTDDARPAVTARPRDMTDAEAARLFAAFDAQGGEYSVDGNTLTLSPEVARDPDEIGQARPVTFNLTGDSLVLMAPSLPRTWTRMEAF